jgi:hypothetical protein
MPAEMLSVPELTAAITRGVARLFVDHGHAVLTEFTLATGRRLDVVAIDKTGLVSAVEVKASVADFRGDRKWPEYLEHCDAFHFAVGTDFPRELLPEDPRCGVIVADRFGAELIRPPEPVKLGAARRKAVTLRFARTAAARLRSLLDPPI